MKPRLDLPPQEPEYDLMWFIVAVRIDPNRKGRVRHWAEQSDRRDADLMLKAQSDRTASLVLIDPYNMGRSYAAVDVRGKGDGWCPL
jgi:hypothetical protein